MLTLGFGLASMAVAQSSSSSSSSAPGAQIRQDDGNPTARPRAAQIQAGGASVTLETSEPLFDMGSALNTCGYDADLDKSLPVRTEVRNDINEVLKTSEAARASRDALCTYLELHRLAGSALNVGQYVSLALYLSPPPTMTPNVDVSDLPPQAAQVEQVLPLLRDFAEKINLHYIWLQHRPEYDAVTTRMHDPMQQMVLGTNVFLHMPVSSYDGRRFLVLLEPMLSPALTNARIYGMDYIIVTSPQKTEGDVLPVRLEQIRHIYLHYLIEPMVYSRGQAMERMQPLLRAVSDAPIEFIYKSDVVALITECLIKAIEAHMFKIAGPEPKRPRSGFSHADDTDYLTLRNAYDRETAIEQQRLVDKDETQGWVLTGYFYGALTEMSKDGASLTEQMAPLIYGMDAGREINHAKNIVFDKTGTIEDPLRYSRSHAPLVGMDRAELDLATGKMDEAADLAEAELGKPNGDKGRATYVLARIDLAHGDPEKAMAGLQQATTLTKDPRTLAWAHIYMGRLYDTMTPPERDHAVTEYKAALATRDSRPDTKTAAEAGLAKPFALPQRGPAPTKATQAKPEDDDKDFDPTAKAEKEAYKPTPPKP
ncbi:DUF4932 domain-containing protein [Granulicella cerasi]|uniref:DUF4932 domain-containing protein n=1 Tax=Granulicella cerasi TaxID=741063 RepID=A0ABW1Z921_9BACT|nr:DUF4932 domain-containing protein [Granulicella cerasi]